MILRHEFCIPLSFCLCSGWLEEHTKGPKRIVDVGCGIGGSSRYLAEKFGASCVGITLSPVQAQRANALAAAQGLAQEVLISEHWFLLDLYFTHFQRF